MLTATTRRCACGALLDGASGAPACAACGSLAVPDPDVWPSHVRRWVLRQALRNKWEHAARWTRHQRWAWLLRAVVAGRRWPTHGPLAVPQSATEAECWLVALREADAWLAAGAPAEIEPTDLQPADARAGA